MFHSSKIFKGFFSTILLFAVFFIVNKEELNLKELHQIHLQKIDSNKPGKLTKRERFKKGLPPNQFHEQIYELTINPATGTPDYDSKLRLQRKIEEGKVGKPFAVRAVANAIGKNPCAPKIPCHRVIKSDGSLGGYSGKGGLKTKKLLLKKEGIML